MRRQKRVYRDQSGGTTNGMLRRRYDERRRHPISNSVTSALSVILQSAAGAKCDLRDLRERRVRIRCKMPRSSEDRLRIIIEKGSAFGVLTESVTGSLFRC